MQQNVQENTVKLQQQNIHQKCDEKCEQKCDQHATSTPTPNNNSQNTMEQTRQQSFPLFTQQKPTLKSLPRSKSQSLYKKTTQDPQTYLTTTPQPYPHNQIQLPPTTQRRQQQKQTPFTTQLPPPTTPQEQVYFNQIQHLQQQLWRMHQTPTQFTEFDSFSQQQAVQRQLNESFNYTNKHQFNNNNSNNKIHFAQTLNVNSTFDNEQETPNQTTNKHTIQNHHLLNLNNRSTNSKSAGTSPTPLLTQSKPTLETPNQTNQRQLKNKQQNLKFIQWYYKSCTYSTTRNSKPNRSTKI